MMRSLYRSLLWLHPPAFRRQFAGEMLWIFDEAAPAEGAMRLVADGFISLVRQWVLGSAVWRMVAGAAVALAQLLFFARLAYINRDPLTQPQLPQSLHPEDIGFSQGGLFIFVILVAAIGFLGVLRARTSSRH